LSRTVTISRSTDAPHQEYVELADQRVKHMAETQVAFNDADAYERYMGQWSRAVGGQFLAWLSAPNSARWLDVGCGTGAFTGLILKQGAPASVTGADPAPAQVEHAKKAFPAAEFRVGDSMALPFKDGEFDIVASALVLHFIPDRGKAFAEMRRVTKAGGIVSGYTWERSATSKGAPYVPMMKGLQSIGVEPSTSPTVPEANLDGLRESVTRAGFRDIDVTTIEATQGYRSFDEYWQVQTMTFHPVGKSVAMLDDKKRNELRDAMRKTLTPEADGSIRYKARAVAFKARTP
jgi:ubiquinone/menaquinone biosynthesis C-methylase UbiE